MADTNPMPPSAGTRALIRRLQADAVPVGRLWPPVVRLGLWLVLVAAVGGTLGLSGFRPDLGTQLRDPAFLFDIVLLTLAGVAAALIALRDAVPGRGASRFAALVPLGLALAAAGLWGRLPLQGEVAVRH
ncbi:MAG TPA: NrsF family protein, partial [bacterium]|nr:NrsF family protein [bacterium]